MTKQRIAGYLRVSTPGQAADGESLTTQEEKVNRFCQANGHNPPAIYKDEGISGASTEKRPGFLQMKADAKGGKFDILVIPDLTRFGRNTKEILINYDELESYGIKLVLLKENIDTSTLYGQFFRNVLSSIAELERGMIKERTHTNRYHKWSENRCFIGKPPFGFIWNKETKKLEINEMEARIYHKIVRMYVDEGLSYNDITIRLRDEGIKCKRAYFSPITVAYVLKNPCYYGNYVLNQKKYDGNRKLKKEDKPIEQHITFEIPPLIDKTTWDRIQERIAFNKVKTKRTSSPEYFLRNKLRCQDCGGKVKPFNGGKRKDGGYQRYYCCYWYQASIKQLNIVNRERCELPLIKAEHIEGFVFDELVDRLSCQPYRDWKNDGIMLRRNYLEELMSPEQFDAQIKENVAQVQALLIELKRKDQGKKRLYDLLETSVDFNKEDFLSKLKGYDESTITIKSQIAKIQEEIRILQKSKQDTDKLVKFAKDNGEWLAEVGAQLHALPAQDKQRLVEILIDGEVMVRKLRENEEPKLFVDGKPLPWTYSFFRISFNPDILEEFSRGGKLPSLAKNGHYQPGPG